MTLDEPFSDLVAVEGVVHEHCFLVVVIVVVAVTYSSLGLSAFCGDVLVLCRARGLEVCF